MTDVTKVNLLADVDNMGGSLGVPEDQFESHFARGALGLDRTGATLFRFGPNFRTPFGHKHEGQEEVYVVAEGSARIKVEDEIVELARWDAIHVAGDQMRCIEGGPDGAMVLAFGERAGQDESELVPGWWSD